MGNHIDCNPIWYKNGLQIKVTIVKIIYNKKILKFKFNQLDDKKYRISRETLTGRCTLRILKVPKEDDKCEFACEIEKLLRYLDLQKDYHHKLNLKNHHNLNLNVKLRIHMLNVNGCLMDGY